MKWDQLESKWNEVKSQVQERWAEFTDEDIKAIRGDKDQLLSKLNERYGYTPDQANKEFSSFMKECNCSSDGNRMSQSKNQVNV